MVPLVTRAEWGASPPNGSLVVVPWSQRLGVCIHYTASSKNATPRDLQDYAQDTLGYVDIHYNILVDYLGNAYEGRGWTISAAHSEGENRTHVGISFIGTDADVTPAAEATITALIADANTLAGRKLPELKGHQEMPGAQTACPGARLQRLVESIRAGGTMAQTDVHVEFMAWRVEALTHQFDTMQGGPEKGMEAKSVTSMKSLHNKVDTLIEGGGAGGIGPEQVRQIVREEIRSALREIGVTVPD